MNGFTHMTALCVFMMLAFGPKLQFGRTPYIDLACLNEQQKAHTVESSDEHIH